MAKNEIKMLLLGAGESGKVSLYHLDNIDAYQWNLVDGTETNETDPPRRL